MNYKKTNYLGLGIRIDPVISMLAVSLVIVSLILAILIPGKIFTLDNFQSLAFQLPEFGILTLAMIITMISGGINLSIIATANMCGIVTASVLTYFIDKTSFNNIILVVIIAILAGWLVSLVIGFINGFIIAYLSVSPILTTIGTMTLIQGINVLYTKGYAISGFPEEMNIIGNGTFWKIPISFFIFVIVLIFMTILLTKTTFGVSVYLIGSNKIATKFSGINVKMAILKIYIISGFLCGIASTIIISHFNSAKAGYGSSYLLLTILVSVLGGVDPYGGFGKTLGILLSLFLIQLIASGFNLIGVSSHLTLAIWGIILILIIKIRKLKYFKNY